MKISDLLGIIEDDSVPIREREDTAAQHIKEIAVQKIHKEDEMKQSHINTTLRRTGALAAACLALAVTAYAAGALGAVNWKGEPVQEDDTVRPTPAAETVSEEPAAAIDRALIGAPEHGRDLMVARCDDSAGALSRTVIVSGPEELRELIMAGDTGLAASWRVPEGYTFSTGWAAFDLAAGYTYDLVSSVTNAEGVTVERYAAPAAGDFVSSYTLIFTNAAGETLTISGQLLDHIQNMTFGQLEGVDMTPVQAPGMDEALTAASGDAVSVYMGKELSDPVKYVVFPDLPDAAQGEAAYGGAFYQLRADALIVDDLMEMMEN